MTKIGIFYGSTSGVTEEIAEKIRDEIGEDLCDLYSMEDDYDDVDDLLQYDYLILGCSTWGAGEVQNDWREPLLISRSINLIFLARRSRSLALATAKVTANISWEHWALSTTNFRPWGPIGRCRFDGRLYLREIDIHSRQQIRWVTP
jgi:hypothetical protein